MKVYNNKIIGDSASKSREKEILETNMTFENFKEFMKATGITIQSEDPQSEFNEEKIRKIEEDYMIQLNEHYQQAKEVK